MWKTVVQAAIPMVVLIVCYLYVCVVAFHKKLSIRRNIVAAVERSQESPHSSSEESESEGSERSTSNDNESDKDDTASQEVSHCYDEYLELFSIFEFNFHSFDYFKCTQGREYAKKEK